MSNLIVSDNKIKVRMYNLSIDGKIVEEMVSSRMAKILRNEYRSEGFAVDMIEVFTVTNGIEIVGDETVQTSASETGMPNKGMKTPTATDLKVEKDRVKQQIKNEQMLRRNNKASTVRYYQSYGRDRNSLLHEEYVNLLRKKGFRVYNHETNQVWIGLQKEIAERIFNYLNNGGDKANLDIKFIGSK